jgi:type II secretion system protein C
MNRFQDEVAEMDRRHGLLRRVTSLSVAAAVMVLALWAAGMPPTQWLEQLAKLVQGSAVVDTSDKDATKQGTSNLAPHAVSVQVAADPHALAGTDSSISKVPLPLYLLGVVPGRSVTEGTAQIGTSIDNPQTYSAGAMLANGARLTEIHSDYVLLKRGERSARLQLFKRNAPPRPVPGSDDLLNVGGAPAPEPPKATNYEMLTDYLRPVPLYDGEVLRGYQLYPGVKRGVFTQLGVHPGDVITAIDGMPLIDAEQTIQMLRELTQGAALTVTVERNGRREQATLDGAAILADREKMATSSPSAPTYPPAI